MSNLGQSITNNQVPWRNIEYRTKHYWAFADGFPTTKGHLLFVPTEETSENLWKCYEAAYQFGFNGIQSEQWEAFSVKQDVGKTAGQTVAYPHVHMIPAYKNESEANMEPHLPAEGILKHNDYGDSKFYKVVCSCGNDDDSIEFEVESSMHDITVTTWTTQKTDFWTAMFKTRYDIDNEVLQEVEWAWKNFWNGLATRLRLTWDIWVRGYVKYQSTTIMSKQQALNYAETLKSAILDVKHFKEKNK